MAIDNDILEKPDKLTDEEFSKMKNHAGYTYLILSNINDFEDIRDWAAFHHEKLNGKGYPFGKTAAELNEPERIMACIDIYQALTESRLINRVFRMKKPAIFSMIWQTKALLMPALHKRSESAFRIQRSDFLRFIFTKTYFFVTIWCVYEKSRYHIQ